MAGVVGEKHGHAIAPAGIGPWAAPETAPGCPHSRGEGTCATCKVRSISVCAALELSELSALEALAEDVHFAETETIALQGDAADAVYTVTEGCIRLFKLLPDGRRQIVGFLLPGDFMGLALLDRKPHLLRGLHEAATHELPLAQDHMVLLGRRTAEEKVAAFLLGLRDRRRRLGGNAVTVSLPITRSDIADYLGLTIETVSRTISKLVRARAILVVAATTP